MQAALGIGVLASKDLLQGDLSPYNVCISKDHKIKIVDLQTLRKMSS